MVLIEKSEEPKKVYDCIVIGAGPGGLQAAIYLCRYNRSVLILDRGGGRTWHAKQIENFLTRTVISGKGIVEKGLVYALRCRVPKGGSLEDCQGRGESF
jgi:thioredoxin reductase